MLDARENTKRLRRKSGSIATGSAEHVTIEEEARFAAEVIQFLPKTLGVPKEFITKLETDSDWAVVITVHAIIEAALNHAIIVTLNRPELTDIIVRLDTSDRDRGKMAFVKALDLLNQDERRFIHWLSTLRNKLVHRVENLTFTFPKWLSEMQPAAKKAFRETLAPAMNEERIRMSGADFCMAHPRIALMTNLITVMAHILVCDERAKKARLEAELGALLIAQHRKGAPPESNPTE